MLLMVHASVLIYAYTNIIEKHPVSLRLRMIIKEHAKVE